MLLLPLTFLILSSSCLHCLTEENSMHSARMVFTDKEPTMKMLPLPGNHAPIWIVPEGEPDTVTTVGQKHLVSFNFQNLQKDPVAKTVTWEDCMGNEQKDCNYNISVAHKREESNQVLVCGTNGRETLCCDMNLSEKSPRCVPSEKLRGIRGSIKEFIIKEDEPSVVVETPETADLYITYSGSTEYVGIHKFGSDKVGPANHDKEQHYVGLVPSRRSDNRLQDKVYAFYREKNKDTGLYSEMWLPFVTQICMADVGGPKNNLQLSWTSQLNARLFCGDPDSKQHFSELVDVAFVHADKWQDTRVYALFRNEWGMSAVCVYKIEDIDKFFASSPFKDSQADRDRECVQDSTKIPLATLRKIEKTSEMLHWVRPANHSGPLLFNHHSYTHIYVDSSLHKKNELYPVLFLSLNNGGIHKVLQNENKTFVIAEYRPFNHNTHILNIILHPSSKKLYVNNASELVQLDVTNCAQYGDSCEECVLARDPYCGWDNNRCAPDGPVQDVAGGNHSICKTLVGSTGKVFRYPTNAHGDEVKDSIRVPFQSKHFLLCPMSSRHAQYTWRHLESSTPCSPKEQKCIFLIDSMGPQQEGTYKCVSEEMGYSRVLAQYQLQLENRGVGPSSSPLVWVCLMAVLVKSLFY